MFTTILSSIFGVTIPIAFNYTIAVIILYLPNTYGLPAPARASPYIFGGSDAIPHSIPWQVATLPKGGGRLNICGGTLISNRHVLTAAHCGKVDRVIVGAHSIELTGTSDGIKHKVCRTVFHPNWNPNRNTNKYDIAILHLAEPVEFSNHVAPACLPDDRFSRVETASKMTVSGWGLVTRVMMGASSLRNKLQRVEVPGVTNNQCGQLYERVGRKITDDMICAGDVESGKIDACPGDSGGK